MIKTDLIDNGKRNRIEVARWFIRSHRWTERQIVVWLFFSLWLTYAYFVPTPHIGNPNIISRIGLTLSLAESGSLDIDAFAGPQVDKAFANGHYYSDKAPGTSFTALVPTVPSFLDGHIHDALTMAAAHLFSPSNWAGIALGPNEYEFILRHNLAGWQTLASLAILPAIWLIVAVVVRRLPHPVNAD